MSRTFQTDLYTFICSPSLGHPHLATLTCILLLVSYCLYLDKPHTTALLTLTASAQELLYKGMPVGWNPSRASGPDTLNLPAPAKHLQELRGIYHHKSLRAILESTLGLCTISGPTGRSASLVDHTVIIGIDTEAWTRNTNEMTEIGLAVYERRQMLEVLSASKVIGDQSKSVAQCRDQMGPFGEELLKKISFYHLRIIENAHLRTDAKWMKGAEGNRFGHSRFVTFAEARAILDTLFNQPIESDNPELQGCKKPVILVGHAILHDRINCKNNGLEYDWFKHGTIVKEIDTQPLAKATSTWFDTTAPNNDVGLDKLTRILGFDHEDPHTACNDAARTMMAAIQMVLPKQCRVSRKKTMQAVALDLEKLSKDAPVPEWGTLFYCTRCGGRDHANKEGSRCVLPVCCEACAQHDVSPQKVASSLESSAFEEAQDEDNHWATHIEQCCQHIADYKAWQRRCNDAKRKRKPLPAGPPSGSHPPSGFPVPDDLASPCAQSPTTSVRLNTRRSSGQSRRARQSARGGEANAWEGEWRRGDGDFSVRVSNRSGEDNWRLKT